MTLSQLHLGACDKVLLNLSHYCAEDVTSGAGERCEPRCAAGVWYQMRAVSITPNTVPAISKLYVSKDVIVASYCINDRNALSLPLGTPWYRRYRQFFASKPLFHGKLSGRRSCKLGRHMAVSVDYPF